MKPILVIMAAGMGSRFGGLKQITPVDDRGHIIIDFSLFDAARAGFEKAVFIIKPEHEKEFRRVVGAGAEKLMDVEYVHQRLDMLPEGFIAPEERQKPWGTGHAVLCASSHIDSDFVVINADDFYGRESFRLIFDFLTDGNNGNDCSMVGFKLENTLTENGTVARGVCTVNDGILAGIKERVGIRKTEGGGMCPSDDGEIFIPGDTVVSMNFWGFRQSMTEHFERCFRDFLNGPAKEDPLKKEFYLPSVAERIISDGISRFSVLNSLDKWYGVTYRDDLPAVREAITRMIRERIYPEELFPV